MQAEPAVKTSRKTALVTGFEAYGRRSLNPSGRLAAALDGTGVAGLTIVGRVLPVAIAEVAPRLETLLAELRPDAVIALGLWPGEPMIRLERFALNLADFTLPDNAGRRLEDTPVVPHGSVALAATLPLRRIEDALLAEGIPARLSSTAGSFLCNAALYTLLHRLDRTRAGRPIPCGFIHLPYLPEQVAAMMAEARAGRLDIQHRSDLASMAYDTMERAIGLALAVTAAAMEAAEPSG